MFREGALVTAVRQGHWVVLDELNLAPTEVLEALNRWAGGNLIFKGIRRKEDLVTELGKGLVCPSF